MFRKRPSKRKWARAGRRGQTGCFRTLRFEPLEDRSLLATFFVDNLSDSGAGSLRQAVIDANNAAGADEIRFQAAALPRTIHLTSGQIPITDALDIIGPGDRFLTIDAQQNSRIFDVAGGSFDVAIEGMTLTGGSVAGAGGAIRFFSSGTLSVRGSQVTGNRTTGFEAPGGGIASQTASIAVTNSSITGNSTAGTRSFGGGVYSEDGEITITTSVIAENVTTGDSSGGGGIFADNGAVTITDSRITGNQTMGTSSGGGGGVYAKLGDLTITRTEIAENSTRGDGGGVNTRGHVLTITDSTISGNSTDGFVAGGGGIATSSVTVNITGSQITNNRTAGDVGRGGGISSFADVMTITRSTVSGNSISGPNSNGGGIAASGGDLNVVDSTISGNSVGGELATGSGGGIFMRNGNVAASNSTISGNRTVGDGGGVYHTRSGSVTIANSTVVDNSAVGDRGGGGVFMADSDDDAGLTIISSIVARNTALVAGPEFVPEPDGALIVTNSLIGENTDTTLAAAQTADADGNLIGTSTNPIDPLLAPLSSNGGPTETHALIVGSPAIDAGANPESLTGDQRGVPRETGAAADMGAFEVGFVVTTADDEDDADTSDPNDLSLREAVRLANANPGADDITFDPSLAGQPIHLLLGKMEITDELVIRGLSADDTVIDAQGDSEIFDALSGTVNFTMSGLSLTGGRIFAVRASSLVDLHVSQSNITGNTGRGIASYRRATVTGSTISDNHSDELRGGGIYAKYLTLIDSVVSGNSASLLNGYGGGISGFVVEITDCTISGNQAYRRAGIDVRASLSMSGSAVSNNAAIGQGGGIGGQGSIMTITDSIITGNSTNTQGGGILSFAALEISDTIISDNSAGDLGGGIWAPSDRVDIHRSTISGNVAGQGGGLHAVYGYAEVTITDSTISGNRSTAPDGIGGGIVVGDDPLTIIRSTIADNTTVGDSAHGGGIHTTTGAVTIINSTISGNSTTGTGAHGGGIYSYAAPVAIANSTITQNSTAGEGGGIFMQGEHDDDSGVMGDLTVASSIVAGNTAAVTGPDFVPDLNRTLTVTNSLIGDNTATTLDETQTPDTDGNLVGDPGGGGAIDPRLAKLGFYGGPTQTHALLSNSPAINLGAAGNETIDQRGFPRDDGHGVDMGAFESFGTFVVTSIGDGNDDNAGDGVCDDGNGNCTLRAAIEETNKLPNPAVAPALILFDIPGNSPYTIRPQSELPIVKHTAVIDGTSEPDYDAMTGEPAIELDGTDARDGASGLTISSNADDSAIRGLAINRFDSHGIVLSRTTAAVVEKNYVGTDVAGSVGAGNGESGVYIVNADRNIVRQNVISGNDEFGVLIEGSWSTENVLTGNKIGTDASGMLALKNRTVNIEIANAPRNVIGGPVTGDGNVIVAAKHGIRIRGDHAVGNVVQGNLIGTNSLDAPLANTRGIFIDSADDNTIGGAGPAGNVISGNTIGIYIIRGENNLVHGNKIGTNAAGDAALPNVRGVLVRDAANNRIGNEPNVISGNVREGVKIFGEPATGNVVRDNLIGTNASGNAAIANRNGVRINGNASGNTIGGTLATARNLISGNTEAGVVLQSGDNTVIGNYIGTDVSGTSSLGNETGVFIDRSSNNAIGGANSAQRNLISGNLEQGIRISGSIATGNRVEGNLIGTDKSGALAVPNSDGITIESPDNTIGGTTAGAGNVISGNLISGVYLVGVEATGNAVEGNRIGINGSGAAALANARSGVLIEDAPGNTIGGTDAGAGNSIGGNTQQGVKISGVAATGNLIQGNAIGFDRQTSTAIPNRDGVRITDASSDNTVGGGDPGAANEIAHNTARGVWISGGTGNRVSQNSIHDNGAIGISLGGQAATPNDDVPVGNEDSDTGANNLQNTPVIDEVFVTLPGVEGGVTKTRIDYSVPSVDPNSRFPLIVEFFTTDAEMEEGQTFIGFDVYDAPGDDSVVFNDQVLSGHVVATATDANGNTSEFSEAVELTVGAAPLLAADGEANGLTSDASPQLQQQALAPIVDVAIARLVAAGFASELFANIEVTIADLPGATLGLATGNVITFDINAAGHGWFVDTTPHDDSEFNAGSQLSTLDSRTRIDLLTVVMHELGHVAGLPDIYDSSVEDDLMYGWLGPGARRTSLAASLADDSFAQY